MCRPTRVEVFRVFVSYEDRDIVAERDTRVLL